MWIFDVVNTGRRASLGCCPPSQPTSKIQHPNIPPFEIQHPGPLINRTFENESIEMESLADAAHGCWFLAAVVPPASHADARLYIHIVSKSRNRCVCYPRLDCEVLFDRRSQGTARSSVDRRVYSGAPTADSGHAHLRSKKVEVAGGKPAAYFRDEILSWAPRSDSGRSRLLSRCRPAAARSGSYRQRTSALAVANPAQTAGKSPVPVHTIAGLFTPRLESAAMRQLGCAHELFSAHADAKICLPVMSGPSTIPDAPRTGTLQFSNSNAQLPFLSDRTGGAGRRICSSGRWATARGCTRSRPSSDPRAKGVSSLRRKSEAAGRRTVLALSMAPLRSAGPAAPASLSPANENPD